MIRALSSELVNGRWLLTGLLGRGSSATVYRGFDLVTERLVAIKTLRARPPRSRIPPRVRQEFLELSRLRHPNLVETYELDVSERGPLPAGASFITMEALEAGAFPGGAGLRDSERLARSALGLLAALECIHAHGLVHRDVKPSNVLLDRGCGAGPRVKLSDLGLASRPGRSCGGGSALRGTIQYAAPEAIAGGRVDARSDLYSLGVLLFEAATGLLPFDETDPAAALEWHLGGSRVRSCAHVIPTLPPALARVIGRLLHPRPEARFPRARDAWEEIVDAMPGRAGDEELGPQTAGEGPLAGRSRERDLLERWLRERSQTGGALRIAGPPGSGLTRFARECAALGQSEGWWVHFWSCGPEDPPFAPLRSPLREIILRRCAPQRERRPPTGGELLALLGGPALWNAPGRLFREAGVPLARAIAAFLASQAPERPLLVVLDDFDRADEGTRLVIATLDRTRQKASSRILIVLTERRGARERADESSYEGNDPRWDRTSGGVAATQRPDETSLRPRRVGAFRRAAAAERISGSCGTSRPEAVGPRPAPPVRRSQGPGVFAHPQDRDELVLGPLSRREGRRLIASLPGVGGAFTGRELDSLIHQAGSLPGRLARLGWAAAGKQRLLFPPLGEPPTST